LMVKAPHNRAPIMVPISHLWTASFPCDIFSSPFIDVHGETGGPDRPLDSLNRTNGLLAEFQQ
jgi:hypothetical protein